MYLTFNNSVLPGHMMAKDITFNQSGIVKLAYASIDVWVIDVFFVSILFMMITSNYDKSLILILNLILFSIYVFLFVKILIKQ